MIEKASLRAWLSVAGMVCCMTTAQIFFKLSGMYTVHRADLIQAWVFNPWIWTALTASAASMIFWLYALRRLPLSRAYPWTAMIFVLVPLGSALIFNEVLSLRYLLGMNCIFMGVFFTSSGVG